MSIFQPNSLAKSYCFGATLNRRKTIKSCCSNWVGSCPTSLRRASVSKASYSRKLAAVRTVVKTFPEPRLQINQLRKKFARVAKNRLAPEVSDRCRQEGWSARGPPELPPGVERGSEAAVRSTDFVSLQIRHQSMWTSPVKNHSPSTLTISIVWPPGRTR